MKEKSSMMKEYIQIALDKITQTRVYTAIVLKHHEKRFAIYTEPAVGRFLQMHLSDETRIRPYTHDLLSSIFKAFNIKVKQVVITDVQDTVFFAHLFLEMERDGVRNIVEIDCRPSDCIILAFLHNAPIYTAPHVIENSVPFEE